MAAAEAPQPAETRAQPRSAGENGDRVAIGDAGAVGSRLDAKLVVVD